MFSSLSKWIEKVTGSCSNVTKLLVSVFFTVTSNFPISSKMYWRGMSLRVLAGGLNPDMSLVSVKRTEPRGRTFTVRSCVVRPPDTTVRRVSAALPL